MNIKPKEDYVFTFAKDDDGSEIRNNFILTLSKPIGTLVEKMKPILQLDGIDGMDAQNVGRYSIHFIIAKTFDPNEIIAEMERLLPAILSDIELAS